LFFIYILNFTNHSKLFTVDDDEKQRIKTNTIRVDQLNDSTYL